MNDDIPSGLDGYSAIADMMSGLMMVFLFIAVAFMLNQQAITKEVERQNDAMRAIAEMAEHGRISIYTALNQAFAADLSNWGAVLLPNNTVRFKAPDVLFEAGKAELTTRYKAILDVFFPRYVEILYKHKTELEAVRIEGHTSNDWGTVTDERESFVLNMGLSQERALETLKYGFQLITDKAQVAWLQKVLMGNGRSFGELIYQDTENKIINADASRRVEFKLVTTAEERLHSILAQARKAARNTSGRKHSI